MGASYRAVSSSLLRAVPLAYRLPNPPRRVTPRPAEEEALRQLLGEGPLALVHGPPGAGKSVLVATTLHRHFREQVGRILLVSAGRQEQHEHVGLSVLRAWVAASAIDDFDWSALLRDPDRLDAASLDAVEQSGWWVVLDEVVLDDVAVAFLDKIERYARHGRWIVVCREPPPPPLLPLGVRVAPRERASDLPPPFIATATLLRTSSDDPAAAIEALGELRRAGHIDRMITALEAGLPRWLSLGFGGAVIEALDGMVQPSVRPFRLRCALEVGDTTMLHLCDEPPCDELPQRLDWGALLVQAGSYERAATVFQGVTCHPDAPRGLADAARLELARCLLNLGRRDEGLAALGEVGDEDPGRRARRDALLAAAFASGGETLRARECVDRVLELLPSLPRKERIAAGLLAVKALYRLGQPRACGACLEQVFNLGEGQKLRADTSLDARLLLALNCLDRGDIARCTAELAALAALAPSQPYLRPFLLGAEADHALLLGDHQAVRAALSALQAEGGLPEMDTALLYLQSELHLLLGRPPPPAPPEASLERPTSSQEHLALLAQRRAALRHQAAQPGEITLGPPNDHAEIRFAQRHLEVEAAALSGVTEALRLAQRSLDDVRSSGLVRREAEALATLAELHLLAGSTAWPPLARELDALATRLSSPRYQARADLLLALQQGPAALAALERLASSGDAEANRRARALLGDAPPLDHLDRLVIDAMRPHLPRLSSTIRRADAPCWGLHEGALALWRDDGAWIDLSGSSIHWKLLGALRSHGGQATKEQLVRTIWGERSYHPGRHDNRLHTSVRKLRKQIEVDPTAPRLVITEDDGYRLGGLLRVAS
jgi:tetratricopeptide (TPR) repeat protein